MTAGWGTIAYGSSAGLCVGLAVLFFLTGARGHRFDPLMTSFGLFALTAAVNGFVTVGLHRSTTVAEYSTWFKVFGFASIATIVAMVILVAAWTTAAPRWALIALAVATVPVVIVQAVLPNGLFADDIERLREVGLFGERFVVHEGSTSPWRPVQDVYAVGAAAISVTALVRGYRRGRRSYALLVAGTVLVAYGFGAYDSGVDVGKYETPYLVQFGLVGTVLAGAVFLAERNARTDVQLHEQTIRLEETVIERTAALIDSNRRLEAQLTRQRRSTRNLASLTEHFERSNVMVEPTPAAIDASLRALLEQLGTILPAATVELRIDDDRLAAILPRSLSWQRPDTPPNDGPTTVVSEPITIGTRPIGELIAGPIADDDDFTADSVYYLALTADHLAGLVHRLELVALVADSAIQTERQRIAMDLHDSVTQRMYSVSFLADAAAHQARLDPINVAEPVERIRADVLSSLAELRALLVELRPDTFADTELAELLAQLVDSLAATCQADIVLDIRPVPPLPTDIKTVLYRIAQEALSNACRHSDAAQITLTLTHDLDTTRLVIHDNGIGFDTNATSTGAGLHNLRTRADQIDADLDITSHPTTGTTITINLGGLASSHSLTGRNAGAAPDV